MDKADHRVAMSNLVAERKSNGKSVWAYHLKVNMSADLSFKQRRNNFAAALKRSAWFKAVAEDEFSDLWQAWDEIKDAENVEHFDACLSEIYDMADYDRCWIEFMH